MNFEWSSSPGASGPYTYNILQPIRGWLPAQKKHFVQPSAALPLHDDVHPSFTVWVVSPPPPFIKLFLI